MGKLEQEAGSPANLSLHHSFSPPSSSIWVAPRATASQRFAKRRRRFSAAAAPLRRPALTAPGRDSSLRPLPSGAGSEPAVLVPGRSSRACPAGSLTVSPATARPWLRSSWRNSRLGLEQHSARGNRCAPAERRNAYRCELKSCGRRNCLTPGPTLAPRGTQLNSVTSGHAHMPPRPRRTPFPRNLRDLFPAKDFSFSVLGL